MFFFRFQLSGATIAIEVEAYGQHDQDDWISVNQLSNNSVSLNFRRAHSEKWKNPG